MKHACLSPQQLWLVACTRTVLCCAVLQAAEDSLFPRRSPSQLLEALSELPAAAALLRVPIFHALLLHMT